MPNLVFCPRISGEYKVKDKTKLSKSHTPLLYAHPQIRSTRTATLLALAFLTMGLAPARPSESLKKWAQSHTITDPTVHATESKNVERGRHSLPPPPDIISAAPKEPVMTSSSLTPLPTSALPIISKEANSVPAPPPEGSFTPQPTFSGDKKDLGAKWLPAFQNMTPDQKDLWGMRHLTTKDDLVKMKSNAKVKEDHGKEGQISHVSPDLFLTHKHGSIQQNRTTNALPVNSCTESRDLSVLLSPQCIKEMDSEHARTSNDMTSSDGVLDGEDNRTMKNIIHQDPYPINCHISFFPSSGEGIIHNVKVTTIKACMLEADMVSAGKTGHEAVTIDDESNSTHFDIACARSSPNQISCKPR